MLLRSSSATSLQTFFSYSPTEDFSTSAADHRHPQSHSQRRSKFSLFQELHHLYLSPSSCISSPLSHSFSGLCQFSPKVGSPLCHAFRRTRSDSNLEGLASSVHIEDFFSSKSSSRSLHLCKSMLHKDPSFSIYNNSTDGSGTEGEKEANEREKLLENTIGYLAGSATIEDSIDAEGIGEFSFVKKNMSLIEEGDDEKEDREEDALNGFGNLGFEEATRPPSPPMFLATVLGIDGNEIGSGFADFIQTSFDDGGDDVEEHYKRMVTEDPSNPLFLRNYGQFLLSKGDLPGAEEYFLRATLADPEDGEILLQYAELVWDQHHDKERALSYFEQAACAAPENSHVLAAYARFLWDIDEDEEETRSQNDHSLIEDDKILFGLHNIVIEEQSISPPLHLAAGIGTDAAGFGGGLGSIKNNAVGFGDGGNIDEYHKKMVEENPCNAVFLKNYAQFLYQSKGDLHRAEEYYSRAILADPRDGETISQYAKLVWELHHDKAKALLYFERAVQATPDDSHVLAAYASFLWEMEDEDENSACIDHNLVPVLQAQVMTHANP